MGSRTTHLVQGAILAAVYAVLTYTQNLILPGSGSWMLQLRLSEALCVLAFFTPAAAPGLAVGCLLFNLAFAPALPLDLLIGPLASYLAGRGMWLSRKITVKGLPILGLLMPAFFNGLLVGWELSFYIGGGFWMNAGYVAAGEAVVLLIPGSVLYYAIKKRGLHRWLFMK